MTILTTTGFYGTGSSAVTNLLQEYDVVSCKDDLEIRFLHDPDGVSDLEFNLIENPNRHNSSHSLKRFIKQMKRLDHIWFIKRYNKYFNNEFMPTVNEYVNALTILNYRGAWHYDVYERGNLFYVISRSYAKLNSVLHKLIKIPLDGRALISKNEQAYLTVLDEKTFLNETKKFTNKICNLLNTNDREYVLLDQLVPPSNISRFVRYFEDIKVLVVDRDPRDIYLLEKEVWNGTVVPCSDVESFCKWFQWTRETARNSNKDSENVLHIQFEDLIYKYDETVERIEKFINVSPDKHLLKKQYFNPEISIKNTQLWVTYSEYKNEIREIETRLSKYCYKFPANSRIYDVKKSDMF